MAVFALGLNHTTAPLDLRGRLAFAPGQVGPALLSRGVAFRQRHRSREKNNSIPKMRKSEDK
jgi:glutamyl-tRNA reductase